MKKRLPIIILLIAAGIGVYLWRTGYFAGPQKNIQVSGNLEMTLVDISFKTAGRMTELTVREGDTVKKGQVIARLDAAQLMQQKLRDVAAVAGAQSIYDQMKTSIEYQQATIDSDISSREAQLAQQQAHLDELNAGSRTDEIRQANSSVNEARAQMELAKADWDRAQTLYKNTDISTSQFDQARTKFDAASAVLAQAEDRAALVKEGPRREEIAGARAQVAAALAAVRTAQANRIDLRRKQEQLVELRADIDRAQAQVGITEAQLNDTTITSPIDGVVLVKSAEPGEVIAAGTSIVQIGDVDHPWLRAYVGETDLGRVKLGAKVNLTTDSYPGKVYNGKVSFIASEAEFTPKQIQTKEERVKLVYRIKVDVDNTSHELKNNMPVDAEIPPVSAIILAENLTRGFAGVKSGGGKGAPLIAVDHLNLEIAEGEIFALVGPDGAGKTTTMRMLCGLMDPTEGRAVVAGHDVSKEVEAVKDQIGYMAQRFGLYTDLTVAENMAFYADLFGIVGTERRELSARLLRMTRMEPFQQRPAGKLSGGMKQKLALMCTLLHKPRVLFLDEPTNGVDPVSRRDFWAILYQLVRDGLTVLVTTAYLDEAERANRVGFMHQGRLIQVDTPAGMKRSLTEACYRLTSNDHRATRDALQRQPGVLTVQPMGTDLHLFLDPAVTSPEKLLSISPFEYHKIQPSLEDVFIALVRRQELARAA